MKLLNWPNQMTESKGKTEVLTEKLLAGEEEYVKKQVGAKLAVEKQDWRLGCKLSQEGLDLLNCEELTETQQRVRAELLNSLTICYFKTNQINLAIKSGEEALSLGRQLFESINPLLMSYAENLGDVYRAKGAKIKAVEAYTQVLVGLEKMEDAVDETHLATTLYKTSSLYYDADQGAKALPLLKQAEGLFQKAWEAEQNEETFQNYANSVFLTGLVLIQTKEYEGACDNIHSVKNLCLLYSDWKIHDDGFFDTLLQKIIRLMIRK